MQRMLLKSQERKRQRSLVLIRQYVLGPNVAWERLACSRFALKQQEGYSVTN